ncbi:MAG: BTAD domain-containing putative transcriptional regulator [Anaerolineales bacterium]
MRNTLLLRTKIIPPPRNARTLPRPRVVQALKQALDYRLTLLQAEAGYGKSTALAELASEISPFIWYQVTEEDTDPLVFLLHLNHAIVQAMPAIAGLPLAALEEWDGTQGPLPWRAVLDQTINAVSVALDFPALLVLDDAHLLMESGEAQVALILDWLIGRAPARLHILLSGRPALNLPTLSRLRAQGEVLLLDQSTLIFTAQETAELFKTRYGLELSAEEVDSLLAYSEGWAIALQLLWQSLRSQSVALDFSSRWQPQPLETLFDVLTCEVFERQPADVRNFLLITATLRDLPPEACDALLGLNALAGRADSDSVAMLAYLKRQDLFVVETAGGVLRYHRIFHDFLRRQSSEAQRRTWNRIAAAWFLKKNNPESAIYHLFEAAAWEELADLLDVYAATLLSTGRLDTLAAYLASLPPETLHQRPGLLFTLGDLARLHSRFEEALGWYTQAETIWRARGQQDGVARALRGQARVYLDTVNPSRAEELLETALRLSDGFHDREAQVRLFELLAENKLNAGRVEEAERLRQRAEELRLEGPSNDELLFRVWLRTGRLNEARMRLEARLEAEKRHPVQTPRAHRETMLILSLIYSFMGLGGQAYQTALHGTQRGDALKSPFVAAVGYIRQGHALMLLSEPENYLRAREQYQKSIEISRTLAVARLRVESGWGLCRAYGYQGDLLQAHQHAQEATEIADQAGDEWIASLVRLTLGASFMLAARYEAAEIWLNRAAVGFQECSDPFGRSAARLWLAWGALRQRQIPRVTQIFPEVLAICRANGYDFLFTRPTLLGAPDERLFTPLLLLARQNGWETAYIGQLLAQMGLARLELHPGYQLRVQTLGGFQVWRGSQPVPANGWRREKARQLFQILLNYRHTALDRDQLCEFLWPEADPATAQRNFKSTLNALYQVLEPERDPGADSAFILRDGSTYLLRPGADLWLDAEEFTQRARRAAGSDPNELQSAIALYQGEYLPDALYETWAAEERERLAALFLETADQLVEALLQHARYAEAIELAQRILTQDNCWERAYRHLMLAYHKLGDQGQVGRTYQRCIQVLRQELQVDPSTETQNLYRSLTA